METKTSLTPFYFMPARFLRSRRRDPFRGTNYLFFRRLAFRAFFFAMKQITSFRNKSLFNLRSNEFNLSREFIELKIFDLVGSLGP